ncbi:SMI1/KNR4 family protein [Actinomycetes bacterium NPDC127524]
MAFIEQTLTGLKSRLDEKFSMVVSRPEGENGQVVCSFNEPAAMEQIREFEKDTNWILPKDFIEFLLLHNGCTIFDSLDEGENIGGGLIIHSLEDIKSTYEDLQTDEAFIPIGSVLDQYLAISIKRLNEQNPNYLLISEIAGEESFDPIELNFELFLDRYIVSQGDTFWSWPIYTAENYYDLK